MPTTIKLVGVEQAIANLAQLPRKVAFKHLRIALNAAGGRISRAASALAPRDTGLLAKSIGVKVKIPDASWDVKHHGRPAYVMVGPKRRTGRFLRRKNNRGHGEANKFLRAARESLGTVSKGGLRTKGKLSGLLRERIAVKLTKSKFGGDSFYRNPSRYAHLVEGGHARGKGRSSAPAYPFLAPAARIAAPQAAQALTDKLAKAFEVEAEALPKTISRGGLALAG